MLKYSTRYSQTAKSLNLRQKTSKSVRFGQCLGVPGTISKKILPKLNFLKAVSVTMITISEKIKKKYHLPTRPLHFLSPPSLVSPTDFLKNCSSDHFLTVCINIYLASVLLLEYFDFFNVFTAIGIV